VSTITRCRRSLPTRGWTTSFALVLAFFLIVAFPTATIKADSLSVIQSRGMINSPFAVLTRAGNSLELGSIASAFSLKTSMDFLGERLDLVGEKGSVRLMLDSPLILSKGAYEVLSTPMRASGSNMLVPTDFLTKALPALLGRSVTVDEKGSTVLLGEEGTGAFDGVDPDGLVRLAAFIDRDKLLPPEKKKPVPRGLKVVVIDPGHGGRDKGAMGGSGTQEKDLVLSISQKLRTMLEEDLGVKVVLTRTADYFVGLKERTAISNNNRADLFLSIHANAAYRRSVRGYETYYLSFSASDLEASQVALLENRALGVEGKEGEEALLEAILWDMAQLEYINQSGELAARVQQSMVRYAGGRDRGVRQAPLAVLMGARMPATLVEMGFITNPEQEIKLNRETYQTRLARSLFEAVSDYNRSLMRGELRGQ